MIDDDRRHHHQEVDRQAKKAALTEREVVLAAGKLITPSIQRWSRPRAQRREDRRRNRDPERSAQRRGHLVDAGAAARLVVGQVRQRGIGRRRGVEREAETEQREARDREDLVGAPASGGSASAHDGGPTIRHPQIIGRRGPKRLKELLADADERDDRDGVADVSIPAFCAVIPPPTCTSIIATISIPAVALSRKFEIVAPVYVRFRNSAKSTKPLRAACSTRTNRTAKTTLAPPSQVPVRLVHPMSLPWVARTWSDTIMHHERQDARRVEPVALSFAALLSGVPRDHQHARRRSPPTRRRSSASRRFRPSGHRTSAAKPEPPHEPMDHS